MSNDLKDSDAVAAYLRLHPDFFIQHPDVLADLEIRHEHGEAISLVAHQLSSLRERNAELKLRLSRLLDVARENDQLFARMRQLILRMLASDELDGLVVELLDGLRQDFSIEFAHLILFDVNLAFPAGVRTASLQQAMERIPALLRTPTVCGLLRLDELDYLFGGQAPLIGSAAVVHLQHGNSLGLLAIGHRERDHFRSSMDTLFVSHLGDVLSRLLARGLKPPRVAVHGG